LRRRADEMSADAGFSPGFRQRLDVITAG